MNKRLIDVVQKALAADPKIAVDKAELEHSSGHTEDYMQSIGLTRNDLKKLERQGLAMRGYAKPNKKGHQVMWVLVGRNDVG